MGMKACTGASICLAKGSNAAHSRADRSITRHARWRTAGLAGRVARNRRLSSLEGAGAEGCGDRRMYVARDHARQPAAGAAPPDDFGGPNVAAKVCGE